MGVRFAVVCCCCAFHVLFVIKTRYTPLLIDFFLLFFLPAFLTDVFCFCLPFFLSRTCPALLFGSVAIVATSYFFCAVVGEQRSVTHERGFCSACIFKYCCFPGVYFHYTVGVYLVRRCPN